MLRIITITEILNWFRMMRTIDLSYTQRFFFYLILVSTPMLKFVLDTFF